MQTFKINGELHEVLELEHISCIQILHPFPSNITCSCRNDGLCRQHHYFRSQHLLATACSHG